MNQFSWSVRPESRARSSPERRALKEKLAAHDGHGRAARFDRLDCFGRADHLHRGLAGPVHPVALLGDETVLIYQSVMPEVCRHAARGRARERVFPRIGRHAEVARAGSPASGHAFEAEQVRAEEVPFKELARVTRPSYCRIFFCKGPIAGRFRPAISGRGGHLSGQSPRPLWPKATPPRCPRSTLRVARL